MSAKKFRKTKAMSGREKFLTLQDLFPEIQGEVVQLMLDSCEGDLDEAHNHLRELDLEIWASKNSKPLIHVLPESLAGDKTSLPDVTSSHAPGLDFSISSLCDSEKAPETDLLSDGTSESNSPPSSSGSVKSDQPPVSPEVESEVTDWTTGSSSDFTPNDLDGGSAGTVYGRDQGPSAPLQLTLDKDLAVRLIMTFGLMNVPIDCNDAANMLVNLDMQSAYKLYQAWKATQEEAVLKSSPEGVISEDEKLARCLQEYEHETYAEQSLKDTSMQEIMDETYALSLAEKDSNGRGMDLPSALQYQSNGGIESKWAEVLLRSHSMAADTGYPALGSVPKNVHAVPAQRISVEHPAPKAESSTARPSSTKTIVVTPVSYSRQSPVRSGPVKGPVDPVDYFGARQEALDLDRKAVEYGARAGKAYADRKTGGGVAAYYLQRSHETKSLAKEAHLAASMNILNTRNLNASDGEIDLHGLRMEEVSAALDEFFERRHTVKEIKIISGRGVHSRTGTSEVRRSVATYLTKWGCKFEEGPPEGVFYVQKWQKSKLKPP